MKSPRPKYFYRIEHKETRIGPYRHKISTVFDLRDKTGFDPVSGYHKTPHANNLSNPLRIFGDHARFGFASIRSLKKWWSDLPEVYVFFAERGFELVRYEVAARFDSDRQSVADINHMTNRKVLSFPARFFENL